MSDDEQLDALAAEAERGYDPAALRQQLTPLTKLQLDILELEDASFNRPGEKLSEFKRRWPKVNEVCYGWTLLQLLSNPVAWEYDNRRYAGTLARIERLHGEAERLRTRIRGIATEL